MIELRKKPTTWKGLQNTEDITVGEVENLLAGSGWWADMYVGYDHIYLYSGDKNIEVKRFQLIVVSSKGKVRVMDSGRFYDEFEEIL